MSPLGWVAAGLFVLMCLGYGAAFLWGESADQFNDDPW
jgi:hypothetical protein